MSVPAGVVIIWFDGEMTAVAFVWDATEGATSYLLQVGTATGQSDTYNADVGDVLTYSLDLAPDTYYARVTPYTGGTPGTTSDEQVVTV
jgi:hypothetical protein